MIISHSKRFIFIKTRKTAGSSLQKALALSCSPGDILYSSPTLLPSWASVPKIIPIKRFHAVILRRISQTSGVVIQKLP
jgi:hypothetical protein